MWPCWVPCTSQAFPPSLPTCCVSILPCIPQLCWEPTRRPGRAVSESTWEGAIAMRRCLLMCRIMVQTCSGAQGWSSAQMSEAVPCPRPTLSPWQAGTCMTQPGAAGEDKITFGKDLVSPRCLGWRHEPAAASPCKGAFAPPFHCSYFWSLLLSFPWGLHFSWAVRSCALWQHCWLHHAQPGSSCSQRGDCHLLQPELHGGSLQQMRADRHAPIQPPGMTLIAHSDQKDVQKREVRQGPWLIPFRHCQHANPPGKERLRRCLGYLLAFPPYLQ